MDYYSKRCFALVIDMFMSIVYFIPICICVVLLGYTEHEYLIPSMVWGGLICKDSVGGRSVGKRLFRLQVVDIKTGQAANPFRCAFRNFFYFLGLFDLLLVFYNNAGRRLGDYVVGTKVLPYSPEQKRENWWLSILCIIIVLSVMISISLCIHSHASSLGLFGLLYG